MKYALSQTFNPPILSRAYILHHIWVAQKQLQVHGVSMLIYDDIYHWKGWGGKFALASGSCRLRIFHQEGEGPKDLLLLRPTIVIVPRRFLLKRRVVSILSSRVQSISPGKRPTAPRPGCFTKQRGDSSTTAPGARLAPKDCLI